MTAQSPPWPPPIMTMDFILASNAGEFRSKLTQKSQGLIRAGARFEFAVEFHLLEESRMKDWLGFMAKVQDENLTFYWSLYPLGMPANYPTSVAAAGTPLVNGASQTGRSLITDGWTAAAVLKRGDALAFDNDWYRELHLVTADATADGSGNMTIPISPAIHRSPANNAAVLIDGHTATASARCACEVSFADYRQTGWSLRTFQATRALKLVEALREP